MLNDRIAAGTNFIKDPTAGALYAGQTSGYGTPCPETARRIHVRTGGNLMVIKPGGIASDVADWGAVLAGEVITLQHDGIATGSTAVVTVVF